MAEGDYVIDSSKTSKYNAGLLQMDRIDKLLREISYCYSNPFMVHPEKGCYNWQLLIRDLTSVFKEVSGKLRPGELTECHKKRKVIDNFLFKHPLIYVNKNGKEKLNEEVWIIIRRVIDDYDFYLREMMDSHEYSSPSKSDPSKAVLNRG